jgi:hypothetical protein
MLFLLSVFPGPAFPGSLLEVLNHQLHLRPTESESEDLVIFLVIHMQIKD